MPDRSSATQQIKELVAGLSPSEFRELCIQGLRTWRTSVPGRSQVDVRDIGWEVLRNLSITKRVTLVEPVHQKEALYAHAAEPWLVGFS